MSSVQFNSGSPVYRSPDRNVDKQPNSTDVEIARVSKRVLDGSDIPKEESASSKERKFSPVVEPKEEIEVQRLTSRNGNEYVGKVENGKRHGEGKVTFLNGDFYEGQFKHGIFIKGKGAITDSNGAVYEGELEKNSVSMGAWIRGPRNPLIFSGQGKRTYPNGQVEEGIFKNGVLETGTRTFPVSGGKMPAQVF